MTGGLTGSPALRIMRMWPIGSSLFIRRILIRHQDQEILVVAHRVVNRLLIGMFLDRPLEEAPNFEQTNDTLYAIGKNGKTEVFHYIDGEMREGFMPMRRPTAL